VLGATRTLRGILSPQGNTPAPALTDPLLGKVLAKEYELHERIGHGGVGVVYLATQRSAGRSVVVKVLSDRWAHDAAAVARFGREARRLNSLRHPNIVEMVDFVQETDRAFLVMEYARGQLLSDYTRALGKLSLTQFVPIAAQILKGMDHAHSRDTMIRDIKPSNIMLCERKGRRNFVKIFDFGLAKQLHGEMPITEAHAMGTAGYLAPEALKGDPPDLRVDVYAVGVLFYYLLSGVLPFEGKDAPTLLYKTVEEEPRPLAEHLDPDTDVPQGVIDLIHQCLRKDPDDRPAKADVLVGMLIEAVPVALFRLPRVASRDPVQSGVGNTGLITMTGIDPSTGHAMTDQVPTPAAVPGGGQSSPVTAPSSVAPPARKTPLIPVVAAVAVVAVGIAVALSLGGDTEAETAKPVPVVAAAPVAAPAEKTPPPTPVQAAPTPPPNPVVDPPSPQAVAEPVVAAQPDDTHGAFALASQPPANLTIDGEATGRTPYNGSLPVGTHTFRVTARGYAAWESKVEIVPGTNPPVVVALAAKNGRKPSSVRSQPSAPPPVAEPAPQPVAEPAPKPEPKPVAKPEPKPDSTFLPNKSGGSGDVFLPTRSG